VCGILGFLGTSVTRNTFENHLQTLYHRGPDGGGVWEHRDHDVLLGHRRLAIIDLTPTGFQPMVDDSGRFVITFNGEIYNYQEIRQELLTVGYTFRGSCDTEVLLYAYKHWGEACLDRLNGMFAFGIYDKGTAELRPSLFLARDRAGKKPLYYALEGRSLRFASELKALGHRGDLDMAALNSYLALGCYPGEMSILKGVRKLLPGHAATFSPSTGAWRTWAWWKLPAQESFDADPEQLTDEIAALLEDSVRRRLISDVPVGIFLSGGLDSSLVTAAAAHVSSTPVKTFTIRVPASGFDESPYATLVARHFGTDHHELAANAASLAVLDDMAAFFDEPLADSSLIPTFMVSRLTRRYVTVALGGDGGDEIFGGYPHVLNALLGQRRFGWLPTSFWRTLADVANVLPVGTKGRNRVLSWQEGPALARAWGTPYFDIGARRQLLGLEVLAELGEDLAAPELGRKRLMASESDLVRGLGVLDFSTTLPDDFLVKIDRASMMNALEVRSPFLDHRLVDLAFRRVPSALKCDGNETRRIERLLAKRWLPPSLDIRRKQGFSVPLGDWFRCAGPAAIRERLRGLPDIIDKVFVEDQVQGHMAGRENGSRLFALAMLAACCRNLTVDGA
jgi:asparagine synthase (glutamine-hydrolysing)